LAISNRAQIDLTALADNFTWATRAAGGREVLAVIKADAYGHGAGRVAARLVQAGARRFAVLSIEEGVELRDAGIDASILVLAGVNGEEEAALAVNRRLTPVIHDTGQLQLLIAVARRTATRIPIHVEVDTGMRRMGAPLEQARELLERCREAPAVALRGVMTHLACADEINPEPTREQITAFAGLLGALEAGGGLPPLVHVANSAGVIGAATGRLPAPPGNAVRPGLMLYGVSPAPHLVTEALRPVMSVSGRVAAVRRLRPGQRVGYGGTWIAPGPGKLATVTLGYADGVPWSHGGEGELLLRGRRVPVAGRVSMDYTTLWVGDGPVTVGDPVLLFGAAAGVRLPVEEVAQRAGTISYELLVRVGRRVTRDYIE